MAHAHEPSLERARPLRRGGVAVARGARGLLRLCLLLVLLIVLLVAVFTGSARIGLPFLSAYKPSLEHRLSGFLESPVTIEELDTRWRGTGPVLRARGVELTDPEGRSARFDEFLIDFNVLKSLMAGAPILDELTLVGADLAMQYDNDSGLRINGISKGGQGTNTASSNKRGGFNAVAWLLTASRVGMLDTHVMVELPNGKSMTLDDLNIRVENDGKLHQVRLDLVLPEEIGSAFELGVDIRSDGDKLSDADGNFYLKSVDLKSRGIADLLNAYDIDIPIVASLADRETEAQTELWGELADGKLQRLNGRAVVAQTMDDTEESLFGDIFWDRADENNGWLFSASDVVVGQAGNESVIGEIQLGTSVRSGKKPQWLTLQTSDTQLLPVFNTLSSLLPDQVPEGVDQWLKTANPDAYIRSANLRLGLASPETSARGKFELENITWQPYGRSPGATIKKLDVDLENGRGTVSMLPQTVTVFPPRVDLANAEPKPLELAQVAWNAQLNLPDKSLVGGLTVQDKTTTLALQHAIDVPADADAYLDLQGQFVAGTLLDIKPWLTQNWMPKGAREWIDRALVSGEIQNGVIRVEGPLKELALSQLRAEAQRPTNPNTNNTVRLNFDVSDAELDYVDNWPPAKSVNGSVAIDRLRLTGNVRSGEFADLPITKGIAQIPNLLSPELVLTMASETTLASLVDFGNTGPLQNILKPVLDGAEVTGPARLEVALTTQLKQPPVEPGQEKPPWPIDVNGNVFLQDSEVLLGAVDLPLKNVRGPIGFTEDGLILKTLRGNLFGTDVRLNAASTGEGTQRRTDVAVRTVSEGRKILERYELPIAGFVSGSSAWRADASIPHDADRLEKDGISLTLTSDLVGTTIDLAEPLGKRSGGKLPIKINTRFRGNPEDPQLWRFRLGEESAPHSDIRLTITDGELEGLVMHLGGTLGEVQPEEGIRVFGSANVLSLDGIIRNLDELLDALPEETDEPELILPVSVDVYANHMATGVELLGDVSVKINTDDKFVNAFISNRNLRGSIRYPREHWRKDIQAKVRVNYANNTFIDALSSEEDTGELPERLDPTTLPPFDIHVNRFQWDKLVVDNLRIRTVPDPAGLRVRTFGFATGTTQLIGEGLWQLVDAQKINPNLANQHRAQLHLSLQSSDFGTALTEMGFEGVMSNGEGEITASLNWQDAIYAPNIDRVAARAALNISRGSLLQIEPGAARLAGIFALQTLPRRLSLDFSDLVDDGLDFATIKGDIAVESGIVDTRLVQLNGPIGVIDITGTSNLINQEFNQRVTVLPRVSSALPIIGIITGGATAGIGAVVAGGVLKALGVDFDRLGLLQYSLKGPWENPRFELTGR